MVARVFLLSTWYPSDAHPALGVFVEEQAIALQQDYEVVVIAPVLSGWRDRLRRMSDEVDVEHRRGVRVVRVRGFASIPRSRRSGYSAFLTATRRAYCHAVEEFGAPDLLHAHVVRYAGWAAAQISHGTGLPVVLTEHSNPFSMHLQHPLDRARVAWTLRHMHATVAVSPSLLADIQSFESTDGTVLGNIIDTDFFSPSGKGQKKSPDSPFRVLSVGLLTPEKGMDRVLEAFSLFSGAYGRSAELVILGDGPARASLERRASALGLSNICRFPGLASREAVRDAMRDCDAFVLASSTETFGVVVAEAMACARPVVVTRSGGPDDIVDTTAGVLVPVGDVDAMAHALVGLAQGTVAVNTDAARMSIVRRFGRDAFLEGIRPVYERAINEANSMQ